MFSILLFGSCSSEKTLSEQVKYDWDINYNLSNDDVNERPYKLIENLKNSSVLNQKELQISLPTDKNNQDLLASNDKVESSVLTKNYSYKNLPKIIQNEKNYKSFNDKPQIFENEKISSKKSKLNDKKNKILWIIVSFFCIALTIFMYLFNLLLFAFNEFLGGFTVLPISTLLGYLSFSSLKKISENSSKKDYNSKDRDNRNKEKSKSLKYTLILTIIFLLISFLFTTAVNS